VPLPAVELKKKIVVPPPAPLTTPPLLVKVPLPAVEVLLKDNAPPPKPLTALPLLVKAVRLPAVALFVNTISPTLPAPLTAVTKFCVIPELFVIPVPLMVNVNVGVAVIVNALAPALNTMPFASVLPAVETPVVLEKPNVAVSDDPLGTVAGAQLLAVFQSPVAGLANHVALPAKLLLAVESRSGRRCRWCFLWVFSLLVGKRQNEFVEPL